MAFLLKIAVFSPMLLINKGLFFDQEKWYSTQKKRFFQMASFKFHEKNYWESSKLTNSKIIPSRENHAHFISCKPPHKNHPREYFGTTLCFIQIATSVVEKSQILSVAFHLATTVCQKKISGLAAEPTNRPLVLDFNPGTPLHATYPSVIHGLESS